MGSIHCQNIVTMVKRKRRRKIKYTKRNKIDEMKSNKIKAKSIKELFRRHFDKHSFVHPQ